MKSVEVELCQYKRGSAYQDARKLILAHTPVEVTSTHYSHKHKQAHANPIQGRGRAYESSERVMLPTWVRVCTSKRFFINIAEEPFDVGAPRT